MSTLNLSESLNTLDFEAGLKPCTCVDDTGSEERSFCFFEGTQTDTVVSDNKIEFCENVWYGIKPSRLFSKEFNPVITARQTYITRILMEGALFTPDDEDLQPKTKKEKINISMTKKKSAVRFLSKPDLEID